MSEQPQRCPVHAGPAADLAEAWPCPVECPDFIAELERQIAGIALGGNFIRMSTDADGQRWRQRYENHQPAGEPQRWPRG